MYLYIKWGLIWCLSIWLPVVIIAAFFIILFFLDQELNLGRSWNWGDWKMSQSYPFPHYPCYRKVPLLSTLLVSLSKWRSGDSWYCSHIVLKRQSCFTARHMKIKCLFLASVWQYSIIDIIFQDGCEHPPLSEHCTDTCPPEDQKLWTGQMLVGLS